MERISLNVNYANKLYLSFSSIKAILRKLFVLCNHNDWLKLAPTKIYLSQKVLKSKQIFFKFPTSLTPNCKFHIQRLQRFPTYYSLHNFLLPLIFFSLRNNTTVNFTVNTHQHQLRYKNGCHYDVCNKMFCPNHFAAKLLIDHDNIRIDEKVLYGFS